MSNFWNVIGAAFIKASSEYSIALRTCIIHGGMACCVKNQSVCVVDPVKFLVNNDHEDVIDGVWCCGFCISKHIHSDFVIECLGEAAEDG